MTGLIWTVASLLVLVAGLLHLRRLRAVKQAGGVTDSMIERIESLGNVELEEPLDLKEAAMEEERFWSETWDEPEEL